MMGYQLVIAEKPSVAGEIAKVIGATKRESGYFSGNGYYVTWCVGHLIQSAMPEDYNPELKKWSLDTLPFVPDNWKTVVSESTKEQYKTVEKLIKNNDVTELVCATDAGREGELIFRLVYDKTGSRKPYKRLWISSMETKAIKDGFDSLKDGREYENLYQAAVSRMNADFLVGINATRLYSCLYNKKLNIGRVQTPTINLIVKRQRGIENFKPVPYYVLTADCGSFKAYKRLDWISRTVEDMEKSTKQVVDKCNGKKGTVTKLEKQDKTENAAALFDLTTLQREANVLLGYSAQQTLDVAQSLYESKLTTYPRTDSRYLTDDMEESTLELIGELAQSKLVDTKTLKDYDTKKINMKRVVNNKKVSDHHAIIPTKSVLTADLEKLPTAERNILTLIIYRLLTAPYAAQKYAYTKLELNVEGEQFTATGKQILDNGYKEFQSNLIEVIKAKPEKEVEKDEPENEAIPNNITQGSIIEGVKVTSKAKKTKPPVPYTEATLLGAMENAGKELEDEELKEAMKDSGLGTPATRAGIIERIIKTGFIERKGKQLLATQQAYTLMDLLPEKLKEPELTAEWEKQLEMIKKGEVSSQNFMTDIAAYIKNIVESSKGISSEDAKDTFKQEKEVIAVCPRCGKNIIELPKSYSCESGKEGCGFTLWKEDKFFKDKKKTLTKKQATDLLKKGRVKMTGLFSAKTNKTYDATIILDDTGTYVNFKMEFDNSKK